MRTPINRHRLPQLAADLAIVVAAWYFAFRLRFDTDLPELPVLLDEAQKAEAIREQVLANVA